MIPDFYKDRLQRIIEDELLMKALRAVFEERIEQEKPTIIETDDDKLLGEKYRAYEMSKIVLEKGFIDLMSYKIVKPDIKSFNKAK